MAVTDPAFNPSGNPDIAAIKEASNALAAVIESCRPRVVAPLR